MVFVMEGAQVDKKILKERLELISEVRTKIERMNKASVFVTDFNAMKLMTRLLEEYQDLMSENLGLQKRLRLQEVSLKIKNSRFKNTKDD
jgi:hypothetical protein